MKCFYIVSVYLIGATRSVCKLYIKGKGKVHHCTGTKALYRPYDP